MAVLVMAKAVCAHGILKTIARPCFPSIAVVLFLRRIGIVAILGVCHEEVVRAEKRIKGLFSFLVSIRSVSARSKECI